MKTFTDVAGLALANLTAGQEVSTKGQVTANDGLGVTFIIEATATPSGDDIFAIANGNFAVTKTGQTRFNIVAEMFDGAVWSAI